MSAMEYGLFIGLAILLAKSSSSEAQGCGETFTGLSGNISSPNYPDNYENTLNCSYYIELSQQDSVNISFLSFATESCCDWLQISCSIGYVRTSPKYRGKDLPPFLSIQSCSRVMIQFFSDDSVALQGFLLRYIVGTGIAGGLTKKPLNVFTLANATDIVVLSCATNVYLYNTYPWWSYSNDGNTFNVLTTPSCYLSSGTSSSTYSTQRVSYFRECRLVITPKMSAFGVYTCTDSTLDSASAIVTQLTTLPVLKTHSSPNSPLTEFVRGDVVDVTCNLLLLQTPVHNLQIQTSFHLFSSGEGFSNFSLGFNIPISNIVIAQPAIFPSFTCDVYFTVFGNFPSGFATNLPQNISLSTKPYQVSYWPEVDNMTIVGDLNGRITEHGLLTCYVPAYPPATYSWTDVELHYTIPGPATYASHNGTYICTATNYIRGTTYQASKAIAITIDDIFTGEKAVAPKEEMNVLALIVGVVLGTGVLFLLVIIVVVFCYLCRKQGTIPASSFERTIDAPMKIEKLKNYTQI